MAKLFDNGWKVILTLAVAFLCVFSYNSFEKNVFLSRKLHDMQKEHDELVLRLAPILPGGPYVEEPKPFNEAGFKKEISSKLE
jgi:hypothetical protein